VARITEGSLFVSRVGNTASYINTSVEEMHNTRGNSVSTGRKHQDGVRKCLIEPTVDNDSHNLGGKKINSKLRV